MKRLLLRPARPATLAALAVALTMPALATGLRVDDRAHELALAGWPRFESLGKSRWDLFTFADGDERHTRMFMDRGVYPWWTYPRLRIAFFRPVAVVTHRTDHALWPRSPALAHLQSLLWLGAMVGAAAIAFRRVLGVGPAAAVASLAFALDDAHAFPAAWIANRNALIAATFGLVAFSLHDRWRGERWRPGVIVAPAVFAVALLSAEAAVGTLALLVAYALVMDGRRLRTLAPYALVLVAWRVVYRALGYGAVGSAYYVDPLTSPLRFARAVAERAPVLLLGQWAIAPVDFWVLFGTSGKVALFVAAIVVLPIVAWGLRSACRTREGAFFTIAMLLAVVPACATFPMERLLLLVGFGAMGLLGVFLASGDGRTRHLARALVAVHLVAAPVLLPIRSLSPLLFRSIDRNLASVPRVRDIEEKDYVAVHAADPFSIAFLPVTDALAGRPSPAHVRRLAASTSPILVRRVDARTIRLRPEGGFLQEPDAGLVRDSEHPLHEGERVDLPGLTVVVGPTAGGRPLEATFRFDRPLEDPSFVWLAMGRDGFVRWTPPAVGRSVRLPASPFIEW